jgi:predicted nucleotidyltransferase
LSKKIFSKELINRTVGKMEYKKDKYYEEKFNKAKNLAKIIKDKFKDVLFLGISGSVASGHPKKNSDIDFIVITKVDKLWKTRLFLRWWIFRKQIPHRKYQEKEKKDEFCFNLWLDESSLLLPNNRQNLKNAVDLVLVKPLINKNKIYKKFILANAWAKKWVATPYSRLSVGKPISFLGKSKNIFLGRIMNQIYFWPQYWYMKRKIKNEKIGLHEAFFHKAMVK